MICRVTQLQEEILSAHFTIECLYKALLKTPWHKDLITELAAACQAREALWSEFRQVMDGLLYGPSAIAYLDTQPSPCENALHSEAA